MTRYFMVLFSIIFMGLTMCATKKDAKEQSKNFITTLSKKNYEEAVEQFHEAVKKSFDHVKLKQTWEGILDQFGEYKTFAEVKEKKTEKFHLFLYTLQFANNKLNLKLVMDKDNLVAGLNFIPYKAPSKYKSPAYVKPENFVEEQVVFGDPKWQLPGTYSTPKNINKYPAVILVHGSGPQDRDETLYDNKPNKDISQGLASNGIAVLRYEKRTKHHAAKLRTVTNFTVKDEITDDVIHAINYLNQQKSIPKKNLFVIGHSQGGMMAPKIGEITPGIGGIVIMAGPARPFEDLILDQVTYLVSLDGNVEPKEKAYLDNTKIQIANLKDPAKLEKAQPTELPLGIPSVYWKDLNAYKQLETAKKLKMPILILQGEKDYQVTMKEFEIWKKELSSNNNVKFISYPGLSHIFMPIQGEKSSPEDYKVPLNVKEKVVNDIVGWIKEQ